MGWEFRRGHAFATVGAVVLVLFAACAEGSRHAPAMGSADASFAPDSGAPLSGGSNCADPALVDAHTPSFDVDGCLHALDGGTLAVFQWTNRTGELQSAIYGSRNRVSPGADAQGQGESFPIGASGRFAVPFEGSDVTWTILDQSVTLTPATRDCGEDCFRSQLAGPDSYTVDTCTQACGDGRCEALEACRSCPADCDCTALTPLLDCIRVLENGATLASFGYRNGGARAGGIGVGPQNRLFPGDENRGQPLFFPPGESHHVFQVMSEGVELFWTLGTRTVTTTAAAPICAETCASCSTGATCIDDTCRGVCGDGWCTEDCNTCPADCACAPGDICTPGGGCAGPPKCGIEAHCGTRDEFGVHIDCGPCPDGLACVANACLPICASDGG